MEFTRMATRALRVLTLMISTGVFGCSEVPPNLPSTQAYQRNVPRAELVEFVVDDSDRAAKVRSLYLQVERLVLRTQQANIMRAERLLRGDDKALTRAQIRELVVGVGRSELEAMHKYIDIQMQLRANTTPEEFARLDKLK